jgi:hypothetical protein
MLSDMDRLKAALTQAEAGQIANYRVQADEAVNAYFAEHRKGRT